MNPKLSLGRRLLKFIFRYLGIDVVGIDDECRLLIRQLGDVVVFPKQTRRLFALPQLVYVGHQIEVTLPFDFDIGNLAP